MVEQESSSESFPRRFGKYHLLGPLAQGGMGALYLAVTGSSGLERLLVIKTVLPHLADDEYVARFRDEAKVVVQLSHANLIPVFDAGQVGGELFLAMDFVEGKDLRAVWNRCAKKGVAFPVDVAAYLVKELCRGLDYAHSFGDLQLVHRDVSPPNVLLSYQGEVKLTDFGLASSNLKLEKTAPGIIYGKVAYMSPEQARGDALDGRSDLYAAGIVLWELLTGRQLFAPGKEQPQELIERTRDPVAPAPSERAPRVPAELDAIVKKALEPRPEDRYATGKDFRDALAGWLARNAPSTDEARLETFISKLFADDIARERKGRKELLERARRQAEQTLPRSHELRQVLAEGGEGQSRGGRRSDDRGGRRAEDHGDGPGDRRQRAGRRAEDQAGGGTAHGVAVEAPAPGPRGRTAVRDRAEEGAGEAESTPLAAEEPAEVIGQILDGRYRIQELIGEGGMGRVYLAEHVEIGRRVAVKILHPHYGRRPELVERFRREARAATRIGHPHIVDVTDSGTTPDGSVYFAMEYLEGVELAGVIEREGALDISRALVVATQICRALAAAHAARIIHRDLKPENVFLVAREGTSDFVKVLDFGIAKSTEAEEARVQRLTSPGMAMGTPEYMAPEQAAGKPADARCDIYALGAILYEMLTGMPPYGGDNFMEILTKKATMDPAPPREVRADIPESVQAPVLQAMARNPGDRPHSMAALEYELTKCLSGRGAAVASLLGISADEKLATSLSPDGLGDGAPGAADAGALSDGPGADGTARASGAPAPPPGGARAAGADAADDAASPAAQGAPGAELDAMLPAADSGPIDGSYPEGLESTHVTEPPRIQRKSPARTLGWGLLAAAIAGGLGVAIYVAGMETGGEPVPMGAVSDRASDGEEGDTGAAGEEGAARAEESGADDGAAAGGAAAGDEVEAIEDRDEVSTTDRSRAPSSRSPEGETSSEGLPGDPDAAQRLLREARAHETQLEWGQAEALYRRVARGEHARTDGLLGLATVALETGDYGAAEDYARRALAAGAGPSARVLLGHAHYREGHYDEALHYYDEVLAEDPDNAQAQSAAEEARRRLEAEDG